MNKDWKRLEDFVMYFLDAYINKDTDLPLSYDGFIDFMNNENSDDEDEWFEMDIPRDIIETTLRRESKKIGL
jgi:hypothetical protein